MLIVTNACFTAALEMRVHKYNSNWKPIVKLTSMGKLPIYSKNYESYIIHTPSFVNT